MTPFIEHSRRLQELGYRSWERMQRDMRELLGMMDMFWSWLPVDIPVDYFKVCWIVCLKWVDIIVWNYTWTKLTKNKQTKKGIREAEHRIPSFQQYEKSWKLFSYHMRHTNHERIFTAIIETYIIHAFNYSVIHHIVALNSHPPPSWFIQFFFFFFGLSNSCITSPSNTLLHYDFAEYSRRSWSLLEMSQIEKLQLKEVQLLGQSLIVMKSPDQILNPDLTKESVPSHFTLPNVKILLLRWMDREDKIVQR